MRRLVFSLLVLGLSATAGCGGPQTRQERAVERAGDRTAAAEERAAEANQDVVEAREAEAILAEHSPEAIENAEEVLDETPQ